MLKTRRTGWYNQIPFDVEFLNGKALRSGLNASDTLLVQARDVDGASWTTFVTVTSGNTPSCTIANPTFSGTALASGTFTMPNFTFGAQTKLPASGIILGTAASIWYIIAGADTANDSFISLASLGDAATGRILFATYNGTTATTRFTIAGGAATVAATWTSITHSGFNITSGEVLKVAGTQVVGARVIDARADDVANSGDVTTDGLIDALRDAMITHGLIAAA